MPRALRIRGEFQKQVKLALTPNGFPSQKALAEEIGIALCTVSNFLNGKPVSLINFQEICFKLGLNWKEIADFNLPQNPLESNPELNQESDLDTTRILLSDHSKNSYLIEQLCEELEAVKESVFISEDWQQFSNEELNQYDCFLILVSHHSAQISNTVMEEIQRVQELRDSRSNGQPAIFLIHVDSVMSLPLNHPLVTHLQGILQRELPQTDIQTLVQEILELLQAGPLQKPPVQSNDLKQFLQKISNLNLSKNWLLTYIGEDQLLKLGALEDDLQNTDLTIEPNERGNSYIVDVDLYQWDYGQVLQIDCFFENNTDRPLYMTLITEETVMLDKKERIRLYRSRKFPQHTLHNFVHASGLRILGQNQYLSEKGTGFIVMMLQRQD